MYGVQYKKLLLRVFFGIEITLFIGMYLGGSRGLSALQALKKENQVVAQQVVALEGELQTLEGECARWEHDPFYKEKWARAQLQMARSDDEVYFLVE